VTHSAGKVVAALTLMEQGVPVVEVSDRLGAPAGTVRNWRQGRLPNAAHRALAGISCPRCGEPHEALELEPMSYCYLLGMYLGDGWLWHQARTWSLRVALDNDYPGIIEECREAMRAVSPHNRARVYRSHTSDHSIVQAYSRHWPCLFPQHGRGKKQHRRIVLSDWQLDLVDRAPGSLLRGLVHTDGWRGLNKVRVKGKRYAYPRYQFSSRSDDIRRIFTQGRDALGSHGGRGAAGTSRWRAGTRWLGSTSSSGASGDRVVIARYPRVSRQRGLRSSRPACSAASTRSSS